MRLPIRPALAVFSIALSILLHPAQPLEAAGVPSGEGLISSLTPAVGANVIFPNGQAQMTLHLEARFGLNAYGARVDPATCSASLTGLSSSILTSQFTDIPGPGGAVIGKQADVPITPKSSGSGWKALPFKVKVRSRRTTTSTDSTDILPSGD